MAKHFILSAVGVDRPGIVADVSELIYNCGCNIEDSRMALMGRHFALMIEITGEKDDVSEQLSRGCVDLQREKDLTVFLFSAEPPADIEPEIPEPTHEISIVGLDRAGIVYQTTRLLADKGINIVNLITRTSPAPESGTPIFEMEAQVTIPASVDRKALKTEIAGLEDQLNVEIGVKRLWD